MSFAGIRSTALVACMCLLAVAVGASVAWASDNPDLDKAVYDLSIEWETVKFDVRPGEEQNKQMEALGEKADALLQKYPDRVEAMIWDGILTSERASLTSAFAALRLAKRARGTLEKAYELDPAALDVGAPTSLGVLTMVPGWPIGSATWTRRDSYWNRRRSSRRRDWTPGISMATSSTTSRNTRRPPPPSNTHSRSLPIQPAAVGQEPAARNPGVVGDDPAKVVSRGRFWVTVGKQLQRPTGPGGALLGELMAILNATPCRLTIEALDLRRGDKLLDIGFGAGRSFGFIQRRTSLRRVCGIDHSEAMLLHATRRNRAAITAGHLELVQGTFDALPWANSTSTRSCWSTPSTSSTEAASIWPKPFGSCVPAAGLQPT